MRQGLFDGSTATLCAISVIAAVSHVVHGPFSMSTIANDQAAPTGGSVRRHHTITATSRSSRGAGKDIISEEAPNDQQALWNNDEPVDEDWVGGVGAVGEKSNLHRQSSLPTRSHRGFNASRAANAPQKAPVNSLAAIAGHEGDEEPWNLAEYHDTDDVVCLDMPVVGGM